MKQNAGIVEAIKKVGSQEALAELLGVSQAAVHKYLYYSVPAKRAVAIHKELQVPLSKLRPDLFDL